IRAMAAAMQRQTHRVPAAPTELTYPPHLNRKRLQTYHQGIMTARLGRTSQHVELRGAPLVVDPTKRDGSESCEGHATGQVLTSNPRMHTAGENRDRPAIGIVGRVEDELIIGRQREPFVDAVGIVGLQDLLLAVVELAIANQYSEPAGGKISACLW